jgi:ABC-type transport system involved in multi-copper enzyme maturation permease subunit
VKELQSRTQVWVCAVTGGLGVLMLLRATARGASAVAGERDRDTWASLLATPLTAREILWGKWAGCVWGQRGLMYLLGAVWTVGVLTGSVNPFALAFTAVALAAYLNAFAWLGIRCSVIARTSRVALTRAVPLALFLAGGFWIVLGGCCAGIGIAGGGTRYLGAVDGLVYITSFITGTTPAFVLAGLPALDAELLKDMTDNSRGAGIFASLVLGGVVGAVGWTLLAALWSNWARAQLEDKTNRHAEERASVTTPTPTPPRAGPPGSSGTSAAS